MNSCLLERWSRAAWERAGRCQKTGESGRKERGSARGDGRGVREDGRCQRRWEVSEEMGESWEVSEDGRERDGRELGGVRAAAWSFSGEFGAIDKHGQTDF